MNECENTIFEYLFKQQGHLFCSGLGIMIFFSVQMTPNGTTGSLCRVIPKISFINICLNFAAMTCPTSTVVQCTQNLSSEFYELDLQLGDCW